MRPILGQLTPADGVRLLARWRVFTWYQRPGISPTRRIDWRRTLASFTFTVQPPTGGTLTLRAAFPAQPGATTEVLTWHPSALIRLDARGAKIRGLQGTWRPRPPATLFRRPGRYRIQLSGTLVLQGGNVPFRSAVVALRVHSPSRRFRPLKVLESRAARALRRHVDRHFRWARGRVPNEVAWLTVDLPNGQRLIRFRTPSNRAWSYRFYEVLMRPTGQVVRISHQDIVTCVAQGSRILTPVGSRAVETLRVGDPVTAVDLRRQRRVTTRVRAVYQAFATTLQVLNRRVRLSDAHPVWADGIFLPVSRLRVGRRLLGADLRPVPLARVVRLTSKQGFFTVYDLSVGWPHNYFVEGILVHNKRKAFVPLDHDPWKHLWRRPSSVR